MHRGLLMVLRLIFFFLAAVGLYAEFLILKTILTVHAIELTTTFFLYTNIIAVIATGGYLFLAIRIERLLPAWRVQIMSFVSLLWIIDLSGQVFVYSFPGAAIKIMARLSQPTELELVTGLITSSIIPLFMIWAIHRLANYQHSK
jgi:hypothetical protein